MVDVSLVGFFHHPSVSNEKKPYYLPLNPGCSIGILISWFIKSIYNII